MKLPIILLAICFSFGCKKTENINLKAQYISVAAIENPATFEEKLSNAAISIIDETVQYDPSYIGIKYPNGDVPKNKGVCTDVVIRAYRKLGIDLQKEVHEDLKANFSLYPNLKKWGLKNPIPILTTEGFQILKFFLLEKVKNWRFQIIQIIIKLAKL